MKILKKCKCEKRKKDKKSNKKNKKSCNSNQYSEAIIPPCAEYLENENVLLLNGELIYRNANKLYAFIKSAGFGFYILVITSLVW